MISLTQTKVGAWNTGTPTSSTIQPDSNITTGNTLILAICIDADRTVSSITDTAGNTWSKAVERSQGGMSSATVSVWYAPITAGGGTRPTITITPSSGANHGAILREYSGLAASPLDQTQSNSSTSTTTSQTSNATGTTTQADELVVGAMQCRSSSTTFTVTAGSGYGNLANITTNFMRPSMEDKIVSATGTQEATFTTSENTTAYAAAVATFKQAATDTPLSTTVSDTSTVSESLSSYSDTVFTRESYQLEITAIATPEINVQDGVTVREDAGQNLVFNPDFESAPSFTAATTTAARWIDGTSGGSLTVDTYRWALRSAGGSVAARFDDGEAATGTYSLKISTTATGSFAEAANYRSGGNPSASEAAAYLIPVEPSTTYTVSYRMKTEAVSGDSNHGATLAITEHSATGGAATTTRLASYIKTTTDWTEYTFSFTTQSGTGTLVVNPRLYGHTGTGTLIMNAWFDDIRLRSVTRPSVSVGAYGSEAVAVTDSPQVVTETSSTKLNLLLLGVG
jgi:hypothetical protein